MLAFTPVPVYLNGGSQHAGYPHCQPRRNCHHNFRHLNGGHPTSSYGFERGPFAGLGLEEQGYSTHAAEAEQQYRTARAQREFLELQLHALQRQRNLETLRRDQHAEHLRAVQVERERRLAVQAARDREVARRSQASDLQQLLLFIGAVANAQQQREQERRAAAIERERQRRRVITQRQALEARARSRQQRRESFINLLTGARPQQLEIAPRRSAPRDRPSEVDFLRALGFIGHAHGQEPRRPVPARMHQSSARAAVPRNGQRPEQSLPAPFETELSNWFRDMLASRSTTAAPSHQPRRPVPVPARASQASPPVVAPKTQSHRPHLESSLPTTFEAELSNWLREMLASRSTTAGASQPPQLPAPSAPASQSKYIPVSVASSSKSASAATSSKPVEEASTPKPAAHDRTAFDALLAQQLAMEESSGRDSASNLHAGTPFDFLLSLFGPRAAGSSGSAPSASSGSNSSSGAQPQPQRPTGGIVIRDRSSEKGKQKAEDDEEAPDTRRVRFSVDVSKMPIIDASKPTPIPAPASTRPKSAPSSPAADVPVNVATAQTSSSAPVSPITVKRSPALSLSEEEAAAAREALRVQRNTKFALETISAVRSSLQSLSTEFSLPAELDFSSSSSDSGSDSESESSQACRLLYTPRNAPVHAYEHALNGLLAKLDALESEGVREVRDARRAAVREIEGALEGIDHEVERRASVESVSSSSVSATNAVTAPTSAAPLDEGMPALDPVTGSGIALSPIAPALDIVSEAEALNNITDSDRRASAGTSPDVNVNGGVESDSNPLSLLERTQDAADPLYAETRAATGIPATNPATTPATIPVTLDHGVSLDGSLALSVAEKDREQHMPASDASWTGAPAAAPELALEEDNGITTERKLRLAVPETASEESETPTATDPSAFPPSDAVIEMPGSAAEGKNRDMDGPKQSTPEMAAYLASVSTSVITHNAGPFSPGSISNPDPRTQPDVGPIYTPPGDVETVLDVPQIALMASDAVSQDESADNMHASCNPPALMSQSEGPQSSSALASDLAPEVFDTRELLAAREHIAKSADIEFGTSADDQFIEHGRSDSEATPFTRSAHPGAEPKDVKNATVDANNDARGQLALPKTGRDDEEAAAEEEKEPMSLSFVATDDVANDRRLEYGVLDLDEEERRSNASGHGQDSFEDQDSASSVGFEVGDSHDEPVVVIDHVEASPSDSASESSSDVLSAGDSDWSDVEQHL